MVIDSDCGETRQTLLYQGKHNALHLVQLGRRLHGRAQALHWQALPSPKDVCVRALLCSSESP